MDEEEGEEVKILIENDLYTGNGKVYLFPITYSRTSFLSSQRIM
jgi:hypothetical protein